MTRYTIQKENKIENEQQINLALQEKLEEQEQRLKNIEILLLAVKNK